MIAHVGGLPVEEAVTALAGTGGVLLAARAWVALHLRRSKTGQPASR